MIHHDQHLSTNWVIKMNVGKTSEKLKHQIDLFIKVFFLLFYRDFQFIIVDFVGR